MKIKLDKMALPDGRIIYNTQKCKIKINRLKKKSKEEASEEIIEKEISEEISGSIHIDGRLPNTGWICHNNTKYEGSESPVKLGYKYSWIFHIFNGNITCGVDIIELCDVREFEIETQLYDFLSMLKVNDIFNYFCEYDNKFSKFTLLKQSDKKGYITLNNSKTSVDIKIGRFIKTIFDLTNREKDQNNQSFIEQFTNKYISFQNSDFIKVKILKGKDILLGYTTDNYYAKSNGNLCTSCMNNKLNFLNLYTENINISLAVLYVDDKIAGRCLIWNIENQLHYDKIYYNFDWCITSLVSYFKENNILSINYERKIVVKLDKTNFEFYPYLDSFMYLDRDNKLLSNQYLEGTRIKLRNTGGGFSNT